ncbi:MAG: ABC transporter ATP-binding protein [Saprospiraceae bacterium]|nr:ABC transporter ATP-binding protein [Saprospiraceae bacterium]
MNLEIKKLSKSFGKLKVLNEIDLSIRQAGTYAVLGPNGSGKTTLMKSILGMVLPEFGSIAINGQSIKGAHAYRDKIDYLPQIARFPENLKVNELFTLIKELRTGETRDEALIKRFEIEPFLDKKLGNLSGGTRQKVNLIQAFMFDNPLVVLDEPTTGLDPLSLVKLKELIREEQAKDKTIIITSHIMDFVEEMADQIIFLMEGKIYFNGSLHELNDKFKTSKLEQTIAKILKEQKEQGRQDGDEAYLTPLKELSHV